MQDWTPWQPPQMDQALNQGGLFVFRAAQCTFAHYDAATGVHACSTMSGVKTVLGEVCASAVFGKGVLSDQHSTLLGILGLTH